MSRASRCRAVLFDIDGTLVDSTYEHTIAWWQAFRRFDLDVPTWRIHRAVGMGPDQLVPHVFDGDLPDGVGADTWASRTTRSMRRGG